MRENGAEASPLLNPWVFTIAAVLAIFCGLAIGAGLHMIVSQVLCKPVATMPAQFQDPVIQQEAAACERGAAARFVPALIIFGVVAGLVPHTPPFRKMIYRVTDNIERMAEEKEIRRYFERYA